MDINIASMTRPKDMNAFWQALRDTIEGEAGFVFKAAVVAPGPGCNNYGLRIEGEEKEVENLVNQITMALMPAKWSTCDHDPLLKDGEFYSLLN